MQSPDASRAHMHCPDAAMRALALFDAFVEMPRAERVRALNALHHRDPGACAALMAMLDADERTATLVSPLEWFCGRQAEGDGVAALADGTRLGAWRIDGVIGQGGMGVVYGAHRADGLYEREVALKTVRAELATPELLQAFGKERTHLGRLEHPAIVALLDAGIAEDGQPWLAMQRVDGLPIDRWCDQRRLDLRGRVRLLIDVCDAIGHAHAHGVLHQDIKPSNLLVTRDGRVKLLDFGLSSMMARHDGAEFARIGLSANYAAPEVFEDAPPSVAIDIYALGVMLYRLFCGGWPRKPNPIAGGPPAMTVAEKPSVVALDGGSECAAWRLQRSPRALSRALAGDLDVIARRCVEIDPVLRYPSAVDLRADLQAWLNHRPVAARIGGPLYRVALFTRRHRFVTAIACGLVVAITATAAIVSHQHRRAMLEAENTRMMSRLFEDSLSAAMLNTNGRSPASAQHLLNDAERRLRAVAGHDRPGFLARGLETMARSYVFRGDFKAAERLYVESRQLAASDPLVLARADAGLASLYGKRSDHDGVERIAMEGLAALRPRAGREEARLRIELQFQLARAYWIRGDANTAHAILNEAIPATLDVGDSESLLASLLRQRGTIRASLGRFADSQRDLRTALTLIDERNPFVLNQTRQTLALLLIRHGDPQHPDEAQHLAAEALMSSLRVFGDEHPETSRAWLTIAKTWYGSRRDLRRSAIALGQAERIMTARLGRQHPMLEEVLDLRAKVEHEQGHRQHALAYARRALEIAQRTSGEKSDQAFLRKQRLAVILAAPPTPSDEGAEHDSREAERLLLAVIADGRRLGLDRPRAPGGPGRVALDELTLRRAYGEAVDALGRLRQAPVSHGAAPGPRPMP